MPKITEIIKKIGEFISKRRFWLAIIVIVILIAGLGYFGFREYKNYQKQQIEKERITQEAQQQKDLEVENLKKEIEELKNKEVPKEIPSEKPTEKPKEKSKVIDLPSIIKEWRPRVAHVSCEWHYSDTGQTYLKQAGSGLALKTEDGIVILTNAHVISEQEKYSPWICNIKLPEGYNTFSALYGTGVFNMSYYGLDWGTIKINQPDEYITNLTSPKVRYCSAKATIGDAVVILGYPAIGSQTDITATEGIVSGYEGDYYITSAKVEHGNSGGVAILLKNDCYLGIPSFVETGSVESLARILDVNVFVEKK